jgi:RNA polymerase sigma-54 factor
MADLSQHLQLRQQQRLVMTPQLKQALKILQLNTMELGDLIDAELAENPMLEELGTNAEAEAAGPDEASGVELQPEEARQEEALSPDIDEAQKAPVAEAEVPGDAVPESTRELTLEGTGSHELDDWAQYFDDDGTDYNLARGEREEGEEKPGFEAFLSRAETLQEHLLRQLDAEELEPEERRLSEEIVGRVDERGYLEGTLEDIGRDCSAPAEALFHALRRVQSLDPVGVAARDLRECLLLQLESRSLKDSPAWRAVEEHFEDVAHRRWDRLAQVLRLAPSEAAAADSLIASLEPLPGRPFGGSPNAGVRVDAFVEKDELTGRWRVVVNDGGLPRLGFNAYYRRLLRQGGQDMADPETKLWLKEKQQSAVWLMRGIEQRHRTLRRVLEEIVDVQQGFLESGPAAFQPLTLKDIAGRTGLHESTISRVTTGKYVQTPRGVFELKFFFTSSLHTDSGVETSSRAVKDRLKELIGDEDKARVRSDLELAAILTGEGIQIARRTVAKYREELRIPPAHLRRRT